MTNSPQNNDRNKTQTGQQGGQGQHNLNQQDQSQRHPGQGAGQQGTHSPGQNQARQSGGVDADKMNRDADKMNRKEGSR